MQVVSKQALLTGYDSEYPGGGWMTLGTISYEGPLTPLGAIDMGQKFRQSLHKNLWFRPIN